MGRTSDGSVRMTQVLITIDTELSPLLHQRGMAGQANVESSINGVCAQGAFGIGWQMDCMDAHGIKGVFFVEPLFALVHGEALLADIVGPILARGHEVQLHIHTEWLEWSLASPVDGRQGRNLASFSLEDQIVLLRLAAGLLERAGAPQPIAFRAGNFGADDNSLRALASIGVRWDTSMNPALLGGACRIGLSPSQNAAIEYLGVVELPVSGLFDWPGNIRPVQVCALSSREMREALRHAAKHKESAFVIVTHSFEMLSRDRARPNRMVMSRFEKMCKVISSHPDLRSSGFNDLSPSIAARQGPGTARLEPNRLRTGLRIAEQAFATWLYERRVLPV